MLKNKGGFTLIELVMIIVILGILAAVAIPKYMDLKTDALDATFEGICGGLKSSAAMMIASSTATKPKGDLKPRTDIIEATELGNASAAASGSAGVITISHKGSTRDCTLGKDKLSSD